VCIRIIRWIHNNNYKPQWAGDKSLRRVRLLVGCWSLTSLFSTNTAISETSVWLMKLCWGSGHHRDNRVSILLSVLFCSSFYAGMSATVRCLRWCNSSTTSYQRSRYIDVVGCEIETPKTGTGWGSKIRSVTWAIDIVSAGRCAVITAIAAASRRAV